ncbi:MAG: diadenylate cyclase CdaA [Brevinematales bacterium]|nr:diadenylate cyclase CdaA [Brevinematales bacterium]
MTWLTWATSVIDIILVAAILYFLYTIFRDTNSMNIVKGFLVVLAVYIMADFLQLSTLAWVLRYIVGNFVILAVVLFQPEIRRVFSQVGQGGSVFHKQYSNVVEELAEAVYEMARQNMGALILIERNVGLRHLMEDALPLDARLSKEMLFSIFYKGSILHDGAVVIQGDRILAARVIIPAVKIDAIKTKKFKYGTRHLAGIAITSECDALALIVSEEKGTVSLAMEGHLAFNLEYENLKRKLYELL